MVHTYAICDRTFCHRRAYYNFHGTGRPLYCPRHREKGMINICKRVCLGDGCCIEPCFNYEDEPRPLYCVTHKSDGMVDIKNRRCDHESCRKQPSYRWPPNGSSRKWERFCKTHCQPGMICYRRWYKERSPNIKCHVNNSNNSNEINKAKIDLDLEILFSGIWFDKRPKLFIIIIN